MRADMLRYFDPLPPAARAALRDAVANIPAELVQRAWWQGDLSEAELVGWIRDYDLAVRSGQPPPEPHGTGTTRPGGATRLLPRRLRRLLHRSRGQPK